MAGHSSPLNRADVERLVRQVLRDRMHGRGDGSERQASQRRPDPSSSSSGPNPLLVNVSARHVHVSPADLEVLYGPGAKLTKMKDLYQEGEFASEQTVNLIVPNSPKNRMIPGIRILGPTRDYTQVEVSYSDAMFLGMDIPLRISGNHEGTPGCVLVGPAGALNLTKGVIRAERHVHMSPADLAHHGVKDGDYMKLRVEGPCGLLFDRVKVREHPKVKLEVHIDTDEGNACDLKSATRVELVK